MHGDDLNTLIGGGFAATIGAAGLWLANRLVGKAAVQAALNSGFKELMNDLQADRDYWREMVSTERAAHTREINDIRVGHAKEIALLEGQILNVTQGYESLKNWLRREGHDIPHSPLQMRQMTVLEDDRSD